MLTPQMELGGRSGDRCEALTILHQEKIRLTPLDQLGGHPVPLNRGYFDFFDFSKIYYGKFSTFFTKFHFSQIFPVKFFCNFLWT